jgi:hypothetical protein
MFLAYTKGRLLPILWPNGKPPPFMRCCAASDLAMSAGKGDFTVNLYIGIDTAGRMHLVDLWRKQAAPKECVEAICDMILKWKPAWWALLHIVPGIGRGRVKTQVPAARIEYFGGIPHHESQTMLST